MQNLSHFDENGQARMVDVSNKKTTHRVAKATGWIKMNKQTYNVVLRGKVKKGDVLGVARLAAIIGAKKTSEIIPLCHPLMINSVSIELTLDQELPGIVIEANLKTTGQTGVEMEALSAVSIAALTIYDMCKAIDKSMEIGGIKLLLKDGGKTGRYELK